MRRPGIEPGSQAWEARIIPLDHQRLRKPRFPEVHLPLISLSLPFYILLSNLLYDEKG